MTNIDPDSTMSVTSVVSIEVGDSDWKPNSLSLENPVNDEEIWIPDSEETFYLPVLATQHSPRVPTPLDFKRQR